MAGSLDERTGGAGARRQRRHATPAGGVAACLLAALLAALVAAPSGASRSLAKESTGEVAAVSGGKLTVVDEASGRRLVVARAGALSEPAFSADGRFVAYLTPGRGGLLHVVRARGGPVTATVAGVDAFAWSTRRDLFAVALSDRVELVSTSGKVLQGWAVPEPGALAFSPSGAEIAVSSITHAPTGYPLAGRLLVLPSKGGPGRVALGPVTNVCQDVAGWTSDGRYVLSWQDPQCSASIAADGLELASVPGRGGKLRRLVATLPYPSWVRPAGGARVIVDAGQDRVVADHKTIASCDAADGRCRPLALPAATTTLDPALASTSRQLFEVRVAQSVLAERPLSGALWVGSLSGSHERRLVRAGVPVADPVPSRDGSIVTFVRLEAGGRAWVEELDVASGRVRRLARVEADSYFGEFQASAVLAVWPGA